MDLRTQLKAVYSRRRRQVIMVLVAGILGVVLTSATSLFLPTYFHSMTATDGETVYLVAQARPPVDPEDKDHWTFFVTQSRDGSTFSSPNVRSGRLAGFTAHGGCVYCLFADGSLVKLSRDSWTPVPAQLTWRVLGIAVVDNEILALGQDPGRTKILAATLDNDVWRAEPGFDYEGDNIDFFQGVRAAGNDYLLWAEYRLPRDNVTTVTSVPSNKADVKGEIEMGLHLARLTKDRLEVLPGKSFERPVGIAAVGDDNGVQVFFQEVAQVSIGPLVQTSFDPRIQVIRFEHGQWGEVRELKQSSAPWTQLGDMTAAALGEKTFVYTFDSFLGMLYAGLYAAELRGDESSERFLVLAASPADLKYEVHWAVLTVAACFVTLGALAGFSKLRTFEGSVSDSSEAPLYATVTDRAAAAVLDFALVYTIIELVTHSLAPNQFWMSLLVGFVIYGATMESVAGGQTLGKKLLGLRVLSVTGTPISFHQALLRNLFKFLEMATIGVGVCLLSRRLQRPGDYLAGTVVVKEFRIPAPPPE